MKDRVHVTVERHTPASGPTTTTYNFSCHYCDVAYQTQSKRRVLLSCRLHKFVCRGYSLKGSRWLDDD
jgi:hypothetical protein